MEQLCTEPCRLEHPAQRGAVRDQLFESNGLFISLDTHHWRRWDTGATLELVSLLDESPKRYESSLGVR